MKRMKRVLGFILSLCLVFNANMSYAVSADTTTTQVLIDAGKGSFEYIDSTMTESNTYNIQETELELGTSLADNGITISDPSREGYFFEGWMVCLDCQDSTINLEYYVKASDMPLLSTSEILEYKISRESIVFVPKWTVDTSVAHNIDVRFDLNGSMVAIYDCSWYEGSWFDFTFVSGTSILDADPNFRITEPKQQNSLRTFLGWKACTEEGSGYSDISGVDILASTDMLNYPLPDYEKIYFIAQWEGEDSDYYSSLMIDGYGVEFGFNRFEYNENEGMMVPCPSTAYTKTFYRLSENDQSVANQISNEFEFTTEPVKEGASLEGWIKYTLADQDLSGYTLVDQTIYSTDEMLNAAPDHDDVAYVAKWSDISWDEYSNYIPGSLSGGSNSTVNVFFQGNGTDISITMYDGTITGESIGNMFPIGSTLAASDANISIAEPVFWTDREFLGWGAFHLIETTDDKGMIIREYEQIEGTAFMTTEEIMAYTLPSEDIYFIAQWAGDEADYFSEVIIDGYGAEFGYNELWYDNMTGENVINPMVVAMQCFNLREDGTSIGSQISSNFVFTTNPTRTDAEFEGWIKFNITKQVNDLGETVEVYELVDETLYSKEQMMDSTVNDDGLVFAAKWSDISFNEYYQGPTGGEMPVNGVSVEIKAEPGSFNYVNPAEGFAGIYNGISNMFEAGTTLAGSGVTVKDPIHIGSIFKGWKLYEVEYGDEEPIYTEVPNIGLFTTTELLEYIIPDYPIAFMAEWEEDTREIVNVIFDGSDGQVSVDFNGNKWSGTSCGEYFPIGSMLKDYNFSVSDPIFWNSSRKFKGWIPYREVEIEYPDGGWGYELQQLEGSNLMSTAQAMAYAIPNHDVIFVAQWAGEDADYYSDVVIEGYGAPFSFVVYHEQNGQMVPQVQQIEGWGSRFRKNGESIRQQIYNFSIVAEPSRDDATFEGWLEFKTVVLKDETGYEEIVHTLVSDNIYTSNEIVNKPIPSYNVTYVAKWSDIPAREYYAKEAAIFLSAGVGNVEIKVPDENGEQITIETSSFEHWYKDCYTAAESFELSDTEYVGTTKDCATLNGWTVYEFESLGWEEVPTGNELSVGDEDTIFVHFNTYRNEDGIVVDRYLAMIYPTLVGNNMSVDEVLSLDGDKYHYASANWTDAHVKATPIKENYIEPTRNSDGSYEKVFYCADCGSEVERTKAVLKLTPLGIIAECIQSIGKTYLEKDVAYQLSEGNWSVEGDSTVYKGGNVFYIPEAKEYSFSVKN